MLHMVSNQIEIPKVRVLWLQISHGLNQLLRVLPFHIGGCHNIYPFQAVTKACLPTTTDRESWKLHTRMVSAGSCICACISIVCISSFLPSRSMTEWRAAWSNKNWPKFFDTRQLVMGQKQTAFETTSSQNDLRRGGFPWSLNFVRPIGITKYHLLSQGQKNGGDNVCI
jgi:hypothetical protein